MDPGGFLFSLVFLWKMCIYGYFTSLSGVSKMTKVVAVMYPYKTQWNRHIPEENLLLIFIASSPPICHLWCGSVGENIGTKHF